MLIIIFYSKVVSKSDGIIIYFKKIGGVVALARVVALDALAGPIANLATVLITRGAFGFVPAAFTHSVCGIASSVSGAVVPVIAVDALTQLGFELDRPYIAPGPLRARCTTLVGG